MRKLAKGFIKRFVSQLPLHPAFGHSDLQWRKLWMARTRILFKRLPVTLAIAAVLASMILWPLLSLFRAWHFSKPRKLPSSRKKLNRVYLFTQLIKVVLQSRLHPKQIFAFQFDLFPSDKAIHRKYINEVVALPIFGYYNDVEENRVLADKLTFFEHCKRSSIAVVPVLTVVSENKPIDALTIKSWQTDFFLKPQRGSRAENVERWDRTETGFQKAFSNRTLPFENLALHINTLAIQQQYIVQPRQVNHPQISDLSNGNVIVFRVLSVCINNKIEILAPIAQLPFGKIKGSGWHEQIIPVLVDAVSGRLTAILCRNPELDKSKRHPFSNARILERRIPMWSHGIELVTRAHQSLQGLAVIGWDLIITPEGPCLIEGNTGCSLTLHQLPPLPPLSASSLGQALDAATSRIQA